MKKCGDDCRPLCDFCVFGRSDEEVLRHAEERGEIPKGDRFTGEGYCLKQGKVVDLLDSCEDFYCRGALEAEALERVLRDEP